MAMRITRCLPVTLVCVACAGWFRPVSADGTPRSLWNVIRTDARATVLVDRAVVVVLEQLPQESTPPQYRGAEAPLPRTTYLDLPGETDSGPSSASTVFWTGVDCAQVVVVRDLPTAERPLPITPESSIPKPSVDLAINHLLASSLGGAYVGPQE